jgi:hypothetical protein
VVIEGPRTGPDAVAPGSEVLIHAAPSPFRLDALGPVRARARVGVDGRFSLVASLPDGSYVVVVRYQKRLGFRVLTVSAAAGRSFDDLVLSVPSTADVERP